MRLFSPMLLLACLLTLGCRDDPYMNVHIEMLNAEKRALEDRVYELEYENETKESEVERLTEKIEKLQTGNGSGGVGPRREPRREPEYSPPSVEMPDIPDRLEDPEEIPDLTPPKVDPGTPDKRFMDATPRQNPTEKQELGDPRIDHVSLVREATRGVQLDQQPGDDGMQVVFQPQNADGMFIPLPGPVSVVLLDAAEPQGERQRVARWDLDATEVDRQIRNSGDQPGFYLTLPWPEKPPRHTHLHLYLRFQNVDGTRHETEQVVSINPVRELARGDWSTRDGLPTEVSPDEHRIRIARPEWSPFR